MKNKLYILLGAAMLVALTGCEPKYDYKSYSFVIMNDSSVSVSEDAGTLTLNVTAYPMDGISNTEVSFVVKDGEGDSGARNGVDFTIVSPANGVLTFSGDSTATITFRISDANVGIYTGRKQFSVDLTGVTNGYTLGGAYSTTVYITDTDFNPDGDSVVGTYDASGVGSSSFIEETWELRVIADEVNEDLLYIDGLLPTLVGYYEKYGTDGCPYGYLQNNNSQLVIPSQMLGVQIYGYYVGITPVTQYSNGTLYFSTAWPDLTFTRNSDGTWTSDYGVFILSCDSNDLSTYTGYIDVIVPTITLVKVD